MLSAPSQCLLRQKDMLLEGRWLLVNPTDAFVFDELPETVSGFHQYFDQYQAAARRQPHRHSFGITLPEETEKFDGIVLYLPKAKKHTVWLLAHLATLLNPNGFLCLVGENKGGIKSSGKLLEAVGERANKIENARHCSVLATVVAQSQPFNLDAYISKQTMSVSNHNGNTDIQVYSLPGVFSHGELDAGTQLLLENIEKVPDGNVLDFACGCGVVGAYLAAQNTQSSVTLSDINALALHCSEMTMSHLNNERQITASNGLDLVEGQFRAIYTNPPFHTGLETDYGITDIFIQDASRKLQSGGELWLVANRFLPYAEQLKRSFNNCKTVAQTTKFTLYRCIK
ncbi:class I SAM-dependent methyltransferase [Planctobacterium marinum]|uniref:class I SAM-dependent methyltransferase n=1 Tax=Planctobacterium marinum TaxID=1631968 RepID=UPI001E362BCE|nr:class I SAM-dependent methyltransferase [Planctobacterium marinum]MCC2608050.1 class I SAM-dependent methyltransferase [Planctobacterium marinum]